MQQRLQITGFLCAYFFDDWQLSSRHNLLPNDLWENEDVWNVWSENYLFVVCDFRIGTGLLVHVFLT